MKVLAKLMAVFVTLALLGVVGYYLAQSGRIFAKALVLERDGKAGVAGLAYEAVLVNYRWSPLASVSRVMLYDNAGQLSRIDEERRRFGIEQRDVAELGNALYVDYFVYSGLGVIVSLGFIGMIQRAGGWRGMKGSALAGRIILALALGGAYWAYVQAWDGDERLAALRDALREGARDLLSEDGFFVVTIIFGGITVFWLFVAGVKFLFSFRCLPVNPPPAEQPSKEATPVPSTAA